MKKRILVLMLAFAMALTGAGPAFAKAAVSKVVWRGESDKVAAQNIDAVQNNTRKNASGAKITSNAHSADFPGIYFIWDSKQKDNGYLKVEAGLFDTYASFTLTSKESNTYWDFLIAPREGQEKTSDDCYVFYIPKVYNNKNINMVFVSEFVKRPPKKVEFEVTVYHRVVETGAYLVYPGVGETFSSTDEEYIEWLNDVDGFTFLNLYLAATRNNDPASMASVEGYECAYVAKNNESDGSFTLTPSGTGKNIEALVTPVADGDYELTFWYAPEAVVSYDRYLAYVEIWNDLWQPIGQYADRTSQTQKDLLHPSGLAHYNALLAYFGAASLPPYWHFDEEMKSVYDYWADQFEDALYEVTNDVLGEGSLDAYVRDHISNNPVLAV